MTKASRDTQKKKEKGRGRGEGERPKTGVPSYAQASRDTPRRGVYPSVTLGVPQKGTERRRGG